ncbi:MAG: tRNA (5-methylaminomethyl-2-thiouridine)(34)-methyltransferase MnmD [Bacteroidetes bacterium]|nr:tRNA (5-methylaminomethyl-2-thiouridine)(34)-methyltransferase MnmD [Bacteroidota bacterium]
MTQELKIVPTADGSNTIFNSQVGENYHSKHGALQESRHVFLNSGLKYFIENNRAREVKVLEVGFGTGLNFLLSAEYCAEDGVKLHYTGIEAYPLSQDLVLQTGYDQFVPAPVWDSFIGHYANSLNATVNINQNCQMRIAHCQLLEFESNDKYDLIYFDAFASARQPEMWDEKAIRHTVGFLKPGGVFVTYAITGNLKRTMKSLGLKVEKAAGAPGKREMLRAIKRTDL